jgi:hypothetical protein
MTSVPIFVDSTWSSYWSTESAEMKFRFPSDGLRGRQVLTVVVHVPGEEDTKYSVPYSLIEDKGVKGVAKRIVKAHEASVFMKRRCFGNKQFSDLVTILTDWKIDMDNEFKPKNFLMNYWWEPLTDKIAEYWVRIFNR